MTTIAMRRAFAWRADVVASLDVKTITAALATIGMAAQYFGLTVPNIKRADDNREANWSARDQLMACDTERRDLMRRLLE